MRGMRVESGSPADKAGVEAGDIITKFDGKVIDRGTDLPRMVGNTKPGTRATITVFRIFSPISRPRISRPNRWDPGFAP